MMPVAPGYTTAAQIKPWRESRGRQVPTLKDTITEHWRKLSSREKVCQQEPGQQATLIPGRKLLLTSVPSLDRQGLLTLRQSAKEKYLQGPAPLLQSK